MPAAKTDGATSVADDTTAADAATTAPVANAEEGARSAADEAIVEPVTAIPMRHENGASDAYPLDADGNALVPLAEIETAQAHGFVVVAG